MNRITAGLTALLLTGCGMSEPVYDFTAGYQDAIEAARAGGPGSDQDMARFQEFMTSLSPQTVRARTREIYAPDAYLNDNLDEIRGAAAIEAHFLHGFEGLSDLRVTFHDSVRSGEDWYVRWTMSTTFRSLRAGATVVTSGMSHVRFDEQGRVLLHRDFWDAASGVYEHVPLLGRAIRAVKARLSAQ